MGSQQIRYPDVWNLINSKNIEGIKLIFACSLIARLKLQKYNKIYGYDLKILLADQLSRFFCFWLVNLNTKGPFLHYNCSTNVFASSANFRITLRLMKSNGRVPLPNALPKHFLHFHNLRIYVNELVSTLFTPLDTRFI